jgi:hypothetical protein
MTAAAIAIENASDTGTILSVKECVSILNRRLPVRRQRIVYRGGQSSIDPNGETLGGAGISQGGSALLDVLIGFVGSRGGRACHQ